MAQIDAEDAEPIEPAAAWAMVNDCIGARVTLVVEAAGEALVSSDGPLEFRLPGSPPGPTAYKVGGALFVLPGPYDRAERVLRTVNEEGTEVAADELGLRFCTGTTFLTLWIDAGALSAPAGADTDDEEDEDGLGEAG